MIDQVLAAKMTFAELRQLPDGPQKKFNLLKRYRAEILAGRPDVRDPRIFGCAALVAIIAQQLGE